MTAFPRTLFLETTTRCNLACAMCARCQPGWAGGVGDMDVALFERLDEPLRHAETVILNGMGEPTRVAPRHFGNICATPLEEVWRPPALLLFRETARNGEYPACGDCGSGLCSDASGASGPFEQDCLGVAVPCGHRPWAVGQLLCLGA